MPILFAGTMFVSALLLFMVQPMIGKMVLPSVGGSPAVWNTCMVFFQTLLLLGYWYAHKLTSLPNQRTQVFVHLGVLAGAIAVMLVAGAIVPNASTMPIARSLAPSGGGFPFLAVLAMLTVAIGIPFFVVSTSAPLLQRWFTVTGHPSARDPYFLYAASNAGSLLSLLAYPIFVEPSLHIVHQTWVWTAGLAVMLFLTWRCGAATLDPLLPPGPRRSRPTEGHAEAGTTLDPLLQQGTHPGEMVANFATEPTPFRKFLWLARAFVPSSLMLGVTTYMTTDIASVPMLWVLPLALYLVTFIIAFLRLPRWYPPFIANAAPVAVLLLVFVMISGVLDGRREGGHSPMVIKIGVHLLAFFLLSLLMHSELARDRPLPKYLTSYLLCISFGGVCGGVFNALLAPLLFPQAYEYPLAIAIGCMLVPTMVRPRAEGLSDEDVAVRNGLDLALDLVLPIVLVIAGSLLRWAVDTDLIGDACQKVCDSLSVGMPTVKRFVSYAPICLVCFLFIDRPLRFGLAVLAIVAVQEYRDSSPKTLVSVTRSYFGIVHVNRDDEEFTAPYARALTVEEARKWSLEGKIVAVSMKHGTTLHGKQFRGPFNVHLTSTRNAKGHAPTWAAPMLPSLADDARVFAAFDPLQAATLLAAKEHWDPTADPLTYYHRAGPVGDMMREAFRRKPLPAVAMVGLGTGSAAAYAIPGQSLTFYEIDPTVRDLILGGQHFTFVKDAKTRGATVDIVMGDARLMLERDPPERTYDLLLIDAFSSDSIPVHLLTVESLELYRKRLKPGGLLSLHISNQYLRLEPVVAAIARKNGLAARVWNSIEDGPPGKTGASWVVLAADEATLGRAFTDPEAIAGRTTKPEWRELEYLPDVKPWTDDYQDLPMVLDIAEWQAFRRWMGLPTLPKP